MPRLNSLRHPMIAALIAVVILMCACQATPTEPTGSAGSTWAATGMRVVG